MALIGSLTTLFISLLVYGCVRFRIQEKPSAFPDIDRAMAEGLRQLEQRQIPVGKTPIFLVLGTENVSSNRLMIDSAFTKPALLTPMSGDACLSIHASQDAIWVFPHAFNQTSLVSHALVDIFPESSTDSSDASFHESIEGTMSAEDMMFENEDEASRWARTSGADEPDSPVEGGTIQLREESESSALASSLISSSKPKIDPQELLKIEERLRHFCRWLRKIRGNICPINGILTTIPFEAFSDKPEPLSRAIQADLRILREELQVRVSNTLLVSGLENEPGFKTMTSLLGPHRTEKQRVGKGAHEKASPESKYLAVIAKQATTSIEDQIFEFFQQEDALRNSNTPKLFGLLCRMRGDFGTNLIKVVEEAFAFDPLKQYELADSQFLFGGCYFAACGNKKKDQAFVPSVLAKVAELKNHIDWSIEEQRRESRDQLMAAWVSLLGLLALVSIAILLAYHFRGPLVHPTMKS